MKDKFGHEFKDGDVCKARDTIASPPTAATPAKLGALLEYDGGSYRTIGAERDVRYTRTPSGHTQVNETLTITAVPATPPLALPPPVRCVDRDGVELNVGDEIETAQNGPGVISTIDYLTRTIRIGCRVGSPTASFAWAAAHWRKAPPKPRCVDANGDEVVVGRWYMSEMRKPCAVTAIDGDVAALRFRDNSTATHMRMVAFKPCDMRHVDCNGVPLMVGDLVLVEGRYVRRVTWMGVASVEARGLQNQTLDLYSTTAGTLYITHTEARKIVNGALDTLIAGSK